MQRMISTVMLLSFLLLLPVSPATAWFFENKTLVTIGGTAYSTEDFKSWWSFWKEAET